MAWPCRARMPMPMPRHRPLLVAFSVVVVLQLLCVWEGSAIGIVQHGPHISNLNVLLPPRSSRAVHYRLQGYNGCFTWFVSLLPGWIFLLRLVCLLAFCDYFFTES